MASETQSVNQQMVAKALSFEPEKFLQELTDMVSYYHINF